MEEFGLLRDFALIMVTAGLVTLLFRKLRQPPILGYLVAGLLVGPYTFPAHLITDVETIRLLADLGLVLLLFGLGLEFSWSKLRQIGPVVLIIGVAEILAMISMGYGLGRLLGWSRTDALFLGAAMHISSTVIIMKILGDLGRLNLLSSRLIMGILVVEDFAAVLIIAVLSGMATTGTTDFGDIGLLLLKLVIFVAASLGLGALIVPRIMSFTHRFRSKEALLITSLGLCFAMAMLSTYLGLSVAAGAFLMGALVGDTRGSESVVEVVTPVREMFAALFFISIGMLIDVTQFGRFIIPGVIVAFVFMTGKMLVNTLATFITGYDGRTALQVGMGKAQMGEFSLAIAKVGVDHGVLVAPLYPVIATSTALTSLVSPYIIRSADAFADLLHRKAPPLLREYVYELADWLQAIRMSSSRRSKSAGIIREKVRAILINLMIVVVIIGTGTVVMQFVEGMAQGVRIPADVVATLLGFATIVLCVPPVVSIWRNLRSLVDEAARNTLRRRATAKMWNREALRTVLRDGVVAVVSVLLALLLMPTVSRLLSVGSLAVAVPLLLLAIVLYLEFVSIRHIHSQMEQTFRRVLLGEEDLSSNGLSHGRGAHQGVLRRAVLQVFRSMAGKGRRRRTHQPRADEMPGEHTEDSGTGGRRSDSPDEETDKPRQ